MTIICAVEDENGVVMGCDSQASTDSRKYESETPKLFRNGEYLFGACGSLRMSQLLQYALDPPRVDDWDLDRIIATQFVDAVREAFREGGFESTKDDAVFGGNFLVAVRGRVYEIQPDYGFFRAAAGIYTIGSGDDVAIGAIHALAALDAEARVRAGVQAATDHTTACGYTLRIERQPRA